MKRFVFSIAVLVLFMVGCSTSRVVEKSDDGIIVHLPEKGTQGKLIRVNVIEDDIIQVVATPADSFSARTSLMVIPQSDKRVEWQLDETENEVTIKTAALHVSVALATGEVIFKDTTGQVLLAEQRGGGKSFNPVVVGDEKTFSIRQIFESPDDEAFYGLGGHQNGQMNYKGEDVELVQHNIVDVVPFVYSDKNYGLLWDNYSISKFGDPRDYQSLNTISLFDKDGKAGGLTATYYVKDEVVKATVEDKIEYEFLETPQVDSFPKDVAQKGKVVWEGSFTSDVDGDHKFLVYSSGYIKIWIDDKLILDKWRQNWNPWTNKFTVPIKGGSKHRIKIEWISEGGYLGVRHLNPISAEEQAKLSLFSEVGDEINYYFIKGNTADEVIQGYRTLTGKAPIVPKWAMGFWQSRERYRNQKEMIDVVKEYRKRNIPIDNIVLDWQYWEDPKWGSHEFDASRFPDPEGMIATLHDQLNTHLMISVWPKFNTGTDNYEEMNKQGFLFTNNVKKKRKDWVGIGYENTFYDPFNEDAGKLFWKQIDERLNSIGVDAWWLDATEPDMHSNLSIEARKENMSQTGMGPGERYFNAYSLMNSKSVYEGQRKSSPDKRVFILTRSAYAGQQRYGAATWSGDIVSRWSDFKDQIATGINFSLSGIPYWTMDIGGFSVENRYYNLTGETQKEWREMNTRWFQFGAFCPLFRSHGQYPYREIYNIAPQGTKEYESMVFYTKLRYRLMPYIYSLAGHSYFKDYTIMRGLVMDFNHDPKVKDIADQYMFGPSILVNPIHEYKATSREVYLPQGTGWYDFYTGEHFDGGQTLTVNSPLERMPLFVKAGSILPAGPEIQYTTEKPADPITLYIFPGADATFTLYEDENINYDYEKGQFTMIEIKYEDKTGTVNIGERKGSFAGMPEERKFELVWVDHQDGV
ncbi:MAG TPA: TIM-barrel domain-containing protein, partial [Ohtaekwangia sp.]|nr:TIM-barrel domain-containing protein [Ohtaekwangia sp.]